MLFASKYKQLSLSVKAGVWFTVCNMMQRGISFFTVPLFTRIMSKNTYGLFSSYMAWYSFLMIFTSLNLSSFVFNKGMVKYDDDRDRFQSSLLGLGILSTCVFFIIYLFFNKSINKYTGLSFTLMICMFVHMLFEPAILLWTARQRFEYKYVSLVIVTFAISVISPLLGIIFIKLGNNEIYDRVLSNTIVPFLFGGGIFALTVKKSYHLIVTKYWKYALVFNLPLIPHFLSASILNQADRIMITKICGSEDNALYSVAYALGMVTTLFSTAIQQSLLPWLYSKLKKESYCNIKEVINITILIVYSVCLLLILVAPEIMRILAPSSYIGAVWVIPPVCGSVFFVYLFNAYANIEYYFEETKYVTLASMIAAIMNCVLNYYFIIKYGFVAAGYTTIFCYITLALSHYFCTHLICKKHAFKVEILDNHFIFFTSVSFLLLITLFVVTYKMTFIRYAFFLVILYICWIRRRTILNTVSIMRTN